MRHFLLFFLLVCALAGCTDDAVFVIDITAPEGLEGRESELRRFRVVLENGGAEDLLLFPEDGPQTIALPTDFSFSLPKERAGLVTVNVEALDAQDGVIAVGTGGAELALGQRTRFEIQLSLVQ